MSARIASTVVIGLLAGLSCLVTAYVVEVPIWVLFIAWASFFAAGGGTQGFVRSLTMNVAGIASAVASLAVIEALGGEPWAVALTVVFGAGILVAIGDLDLLSFTPAGFLGFASIVGTVSASGISVTAAITFDHPAVQVLVAMALGAVFGIVSEKLSAAATAPQPQPESSVAA
jgi:hypothetical protein